MKQAEVVVRLPSGDSDPVRVGAVLSYEGRRPVRIRVRWEDDGAEDTVSVDSRTSIAIRGSLEYVRLVAPASLREMLADDPGALISRLLEEKAKDSGMTAAAVKEALVRLGLNEEAVAKAWKTAQKGLTKNNQILVENRTYRWVEPPAKHSTADSTRASDTSQEGSDADPAEEPNSVAAAIAQVIGDEIPRSIAHYRKEPLRIGQSLARLSDSTLARLVDRLAPEDRAQALGMLLALPRPAPVLDAPKRLAPLAQREAEAILTAAADEIRNRRRPSAADRAAACWLVRRADAVRALSSAVAPSLIELAGQIAVDPQGSDLEPLNIAARAMSRILRHLPPDAAQSVDLDRLAAAVARLPLTPQGGRVALLAALGRTMPKRLADEIWWRGVKLRELADCATGVLGAVTSLPAVAEQIVRPLVRGELAAVRSRTQLGFLVGLPREFAEQLPPREVAAACRRVAGEDQFVGEWLKAMTDGERAEALRRDLEAARAEAASVTQRAEAAEQKIQELAERCDRLGAMLREEHAQAVALRASRERQIRIDVIRALADLAAEVEELVSNDTTSVVLVERVRALVAVHGLKPVTTAGAAVGFDPAVHQAIVDPPAPGAAVSVIRPGFWWHTSDGDVLVYKALVSPS